ncbi:MAG: hypothetical protein AAGF15_01105 [Pseudomonadota bacterium]
MTSPPRSPQLSSNGARALEIDLIENIARWFGVSPERAPDIRQEAKQALQMPTLNHAGSATMGWLATALAFDLSDSGDRLFPNGNRGMPLALSHWVHRVANEARTHRATGVHLALIERQISDGRPFLQGDRLGLVDLMCRAIAKHARKDSTSDELVASHFPHIADWLGRVDESLRAAGDGGEKPSEAVGAWLYLPDQWPHDESRLAAAPGALMRGASVRISMDRTPNASWEGTLYYASYDLVWACDADGLMCLFAALEVNIDPA